MRFSLGRKGALPMMGFVVRRVLGAVALAVGIALIVWFVYNLLWPTEEFKSGFRNVFQLIVPIACLIAGWKWIRYEGKGIEQITPPDFDCPELKASVERARNTLPTFVAEVEKGIDGAFVKFPLRTPQGFIEHIWAYVHFFKDGRFNVSLANEPFDENQDSKGRRNVPIKDVEDWQIMHPDGRISGAHSLMALFRYHENKGLKLSPLMRKQKAQLVDAS
jgi:uncharacterized protein YegJ (DUF2314 family)